MKYFNDVRCVEDLIQDFKIVEHLPQEQEILFADMDESGYDGIARILFQRDGVLYEVRGSHCSCAGFEGQWDPQVVTWEQLAMRPPYKDNGKGAAAKTWEALVRHHVPRA